MFGNFLRLDFLSHNARVQMHTVCIKWKLKNMKLDNIRFLGLMTGSRRCIDRWLHAEFDSVILGFLRRMDRVRLLSRYKPRRQGSKCFRTLNVKSEGMGKLVNLKDCGWGADEKASEGSEFQSVGHPNIMHGNIYNRDTGLQLDADVLRLEFLLKKWGYRWLGLLSP